MTKLVSCFRFKAPKIYRDDMSMTGLLAACLRAAPRKYQLDVEMVKK